MFRWFGMAVLMMASPAGAAVIDFEGYAVGSTPIKVGEPFPFLSTKNGQIGGDDSNKYLSFTFDDSIGPRVVRLVLRSREIGPEGGEQFLEYPTILSFDLFSTYGGKLIRQTNERLLATFEAGSSTIFPDDLHVGNGRLHFDFVLPSSTAGEVRIDNIEYSISYVRVPEPSTWALMLIGFGGIGGVVRHRSKRMVAERRIAR